MKHVFQVQYSLPISLKILDEIKQKWRYAYNFQLVYLVVKSVLLNTRKDS
jgi:hypothetical protein